MTAIFEKLAYSIQNSFGNIHLDSDDRLWIAIGALVLVVIVMWFTLERAKMAMVLLALYSAGLIILHTPVGKAVTKSLSAQELNYAQTVWAFLPVVALGILGIKKRKKRRSQARST